MKNRTRAALGFAAMDFGIFAATVGFLPRPGSWGSTGLLSYYINSRTRWDIAWTVLVAAMIFSVGLFLLLESLGAFTDKDREP